MNNRHADWLCELPLPIIATVIPTPKLLAIRLPDMSALTWNEIEKILQRLSVRAVQIDRPATFYQDVLDSMAAVADGGAAVWLLSANRDSDRMLENHDAQANNGHNWYLSQPDQRERLVRLASDEPDARPLNPQETGEKTLVRTIEIDRRPVALMEVSIASTTDAQQRHTIEQVADAVVEVASDWHRNRELNRLRTENHEWTQLLRVQFDVLTSARRESYWHVLANESRRFVECDRVTVLTQTDRKPTIVAVSGLDQWDARSKAMQSLQAAVGQLAEAGELEWEWAADAEDSGAFEDYLKVSSPRSVRIRCVEDSGKERPLPAVWFVCESFEARPEDVDEAGRLQRFVEAVARPSLTSGARANRKRSVTRGIRKIVILAVLAAAVAAMFAPVPFRIRGDGELLPVNRADVFAPALADVERVLVREKQQVTENQDLLELVDDKLDFELSQVLGNRKTAESRLATIRNERVRLGREGQGSSIEALRLSAEETEVQALISSLEEQQALCEEQREKLTLTSPISGTITTWDFEQLLEGRPVRPGQRLLTIAQLDGEWTVEALVPDEHIGFIREQWEASDGQVSVNLTPATDSESMLTGVVTDIAPATELNAASETVVRIRIEIDRDKLTDARPNATVVARFDCGERPLGFVLFHDLIRRVREWQMF